MTHVSLLAPWMVPDAQTTHRLHVERAVLFAVAKPQRPRGEPHRRRQGASAGLVPELS